VTVQRLVTLGAGDGGDVDACCPGTQEGLTAGPGGGAGGVNVVDEQYMMACDGALRLFTGNGKSATHVDAALMGAEPGLAFRGPAALEYPRGELKPHLRLLLPETADEAVGEMLGLIESAAAFAAAMQRDGHDEQGLGKVSNIENALGKQCAEAGSNGFNAVVFKQVDELAELVPVNSPGNSEREGRLGHAANAAERILLAGSGDKIDAEIFSAMGAKGSRLWMEMVPTGRTDGDGGEFSERGAAEAAGRWEQNGGDSFEGA